MTIAGSTHSIEASFETKTTEYGTPSPRLLIRVHGETHWRLLSAFGHRAAAEVELALHEAGLPALVTLMDSQDWWVGRRRMGGQTGIAIELVGNDRRLSIEAESKQVVAVLEGLAAQINAANRRRS